MGWSATAVFLSGAISCLQTGKHLVGVKEPLVSYSNAVEHRNDELAKPPIDRRIVFLT